MKLLNKMMALQEETGAVSDEALKILAREENVPLYRLEGLRGFYPVFRAQRGAPIRLQVCRDLPCMMKDGDGLLAELGPLLAGVSGVEIEPVSCLGRCDSAPACALNDHPVRGTAQQIAALANNPGGPPTGDPPRSSRQWPTDPYKDPGQRYQVLRGLIAPGEDPDREASAVEATAAKANVLETLKASGLRGMGGAGFPTGMKWDFTQRAQGNPKYIICNADESEPGTFKDREILADLPHLVIEAMAIAGWLIGAREGIVYLRHEYAAEGRALKAELERARAAGILGTHAFGKESAFDITVFVSPGGYIMGEETALLEALEDRRGEPRNKPPFPTNHGLWGKPTLINNVETFAAVPIILARGADWWLAQGKAGFAGLKFLSVSGDVGNPGVYCVPMGTTIAEMLDGCGGVSGGASLAAFAPGGASSNFLPAHQQHLPLDFQALQDAGSMLGSGAVVFVAQGRDLVGLATNVVSFFRNESCGKCVPCRVGSHKAVEMMEAALKGSAAADPDALVGALESLGDTLGQTSICGLGQIALQPLLSIFRNFPVESRARVSQDNATGGSPESPDGPQENGHD